MSKIIIDLPDELLKAIDERCGKTAPFVNRSEFINFALAEYLRIGGSKKDEQKSFWAWEETEEEWRPG